jgi:hypothetical protein
VGVGRDYTIYALEPGWVYFRKDKHTKKQYVSVLPVSPHAHERAIIARQEAARAAP